MNDLLNTTIDTSKLTPIEIVLGIDKNGMTTAKKLYEFLELDKSQYARWCRCNITGNEFAEENTDYWGFSTQMSKTPKVEDPHKIISLPLVLQKSSP